MRKRTHRFIVVLPLLFAAGVTAVTATILLSSNEDDPFLLYSVGQDREDDGGFSNFYEGDMVWRGVETDE